MTLDELCFTLPNGFHDAELRKAVLDYENCLAQLTLDVWVGNLGGSPSEHELYRSAEVILEGLAFWIIEPPDPGYLPMLPGSVTIDISGAEHVPASIRELPISTGTFWNTICVSDWNRCIYLAARNARLIWLGDASPRD